MSIEMQAEANEANVVDFALVPKLRLETPLRGTPFRE